MDLSLHLARFLVINFAVWLAMGSRPNTIAHASNARSPKDFRYEFRQAITKAIAAGSRIAQEQCKNHFRWERWNCPKTAFSRQFEATATREMAFVVSITAAGIVYSVTRKCSMGDIPSCGCSKPPEDQPPIDENSLTEKTWSWGGCSDDVAIGDTVSQTFLESLEEGNLDVPSRVNSHNSRLGRLVVREHVRPECKCHGLSGSCTTKTCWRKIVPFAQVAAALKHRYQRAQRIQVNTANKLSHLDIPPNQMIFLAESPDYCKENATAGWAGTGGRICSRGRPGVEDKSEKRSCRELCRACGHQVKKRPVKTTWHCNCTFHWCCEVECKTCYKTLQQFYCDDSPLRY